jgi:hypothetical protein
MSDYNLISEQIELKKKQIELKKQQIKLNDINLESEQTKLQFKEKQIKHERMKLAKEKQLEMYKNMQMISEIIHNTNTTGVITKKQIAAMEEITLNCQILEQLL